MIKFLPWLWNRRFSLKSQRNLMSCALAVGPSAPSTSAAPTEHKDFCFSVAQQLIGRGLLSSAQKVIQRIISTSPSLSEAKAAIEFANSRGIELDLSCTSCFIEKLVSYGECNLAETLYLGIVSYNGFQPSRSLLNSMIVCYCELGKVDEAKSCFDKVIGMKFVPNSRACSAMITQFCFQDRQFEGYDYFLRVLDTDILLGDSCYNKLVHDLCHLGYLDEARSVYHVMCDNGVPPTVHMCKTLIFGFCRRGRIEEAESLCREMELYGFFIDKVMYTSLIQGYFRKHQVKMATRLFLRMLQTGCRPDNSAYNTLIRGFMNLGLIDQCSMVHRMMKESGLEPDVLIYQVMISKCCKKGDVDRGLKIFRNMIQLNLTPSVQCYTALISALGKAKRMQEISHLHDLIIGNGLIPDHVLFLSLVRNFPKGLELQLALECLQTIARNGCHLDLATRPDFTGTISPGTVISDIECLLEIITGVDLFLGKMAFNIYVIALCHGENLEAALVCINKMLKSGLLPSMTAYNSLIKCLCQAGLVDWVKNVIKIMQDQGLAPDQATCLIMVTESCKREDVSSAIDILYQMEEREIIPSVAIYDSIISQLGKELLVFEAEKWFNRMEEAYVEADEAVYATMINAYSKSGRAIKARILFEKMLKDGGIPTSKSFNALINALIKKNMTLKACEYIARMFEQGIEPSAALYTSLINQYLRKGHFEFSFRLYYLMQKSLIEPDLVTYIVFLSGICRNIKGIEGKQYVPLESSELAMGRLFNLLNQRIMVPNRKDLRVFMKSRNDLKVYIAKLIKQMADTSLMRNLHLYNGVISGLCCLNNLEEAYRFFLAMPQKEMVPNHVTFSILIDCHARLGEINIAIRLFNEMNAACCPPDRIPYDMLIKGLCKAGRFLEALSVSQTMCKRGFYPSWASYENLLCCSCGDHASDDALKILEDMLGQGQIPCRFNLQRLVYLFHEHNKLYESCIVQNLLLKKEDML